MKSTGYDFCSLLPLLLLPRLWISPFATPADSCGTSSSCWLSAILCMFVSPEWLLMFTKIVNVFLGAELMLFEFCAAEAGCLNCTWLSRYGWPLNDLSQCLHLTVMWPIIPCSSIVLETMTVLLYSGFLLSWKFSRSHFEWRKVKLPSWISLGKSLLSAQIKL